MEFSLEKVLKNFILVALNFDQPSFTPFLIKKGFFFFVRRYFLLAKFIICADGGLNSFHKWLDISEDKKFYNCNI
jgi:hypothetical protein